MFITSKNKYLSNDMKIFGTCSIPLRSIKHCATIPERHSTNKSISSMVHYTYNVFLCLDFAVLKDTSICDTLNMSDS